MPTCFSLVEDRELKRMRMRLLVVLAVVGAMSACGGGAGPAFMEFVEIQPAQPKIGDVVTVRFRLLDERSIPLAGSVVDYKLGSANTGVTLSPASSVSLKGSGYAETQVVASSRVNSVVVIATSGAKSVTSPPITFAGSVPNGRQMTFQCGPIAADGSGGRHAIGAYDQARHLIAGSAINCTAHVADRNGDGFTGALVSFLTEAGTIGPTETSQANLVGDATVLYKTSLPMPEDVDPDVFSWTPPQGDLLNTGEYLAPLWMQPFNWVENPATIGTVANPTFTLREPRRPDPIRFKPDGTGRFTNNCRDNLVSMIAVTSGEEGFTDTNNNGVYDQGEEFDDLTEPFVDSNDNGTWDANERFIDLNGNREWNGKNGKWDPNTLIWKQERLLWTGIPAWEDLQLPASLPTVPGHRPVFTPVAPPTMNFVCPPGSLSCTQAGNAADLYKPFSVSAYIADPWFNAMAQNGDGDSCEIPNSDMSPIKVSGQQLSGVVFTYPAGSFLHFSVRDARDPNVPPVDQVPKRSPPIGFRNTIVCSFTSSPSNGYVVKVAAGTVEGTIE
jgi:hypothetical protein